jgi:hypothetical protein
MRSPISLSMLRQYSQARSSTGSDTPLLRCPTTLDTGMARRLPEIVDDGPLQPFVSVTSLRDPRPRSTSGDRGSTDIRWTDGVHGARAEAAEWTRADEAVTRAARREGEEVMWRRQP